MFWWVVASFSVVAESGVVLVPSSPVGPGECVVRWDAVGECQSGDEPSDFRDGDGDQIGAVFFEVALWARERMTASVA